MFARSSLDFGYTKQTQPTQVSSEERMNLSFICFFGGKVMVDWRSLLSVSLYAETDACTVRCSVYVLRVVRAGALAMFACKQSQSVLSALHPKMQTVRMLCAAHISAYSNTKFGSSYAFQATRGAL